MANICMDTIVFYTDDGENSKNLLQMKEAIKSCYPIGTSHEESNLGRLFTYLNIPTEGLYLRGGVVDYSIEDSHIQLSCDSAWRPMKDGYEALSNHFGLKMVFTAEEPGNELYYNTDDEGLYLEISYKVVLLDKPSDGSLDALFQESGGDTDFYFNNDTKLLQWFWEIGHIKAATIHELIELVNSDYVTFHEYTNPY